jgi:putative tributyrin esterase
MRRALTLLALAACGTSHSTTPAPTAAPGPSRVETHSFSSPSLGVAKDYLVYLPAGYDAGARRYPVIYMLHGLSGNETNWTEKGDLAKVADALSLQAIIVMPDGDASFYVNWATPADFASCQGNPFNPREKADKYCVREARYEDYMTRDLIAHVDSAYRTIPEARARGIGGLSMGGFGALTLSMRHPDLYGAAVSHSGVDALLYAGPHPYVKGQAQLGKTAADLQAWAKAAGGIGALFLAILGTDVANWQAHDPTALVASLKAGHPALYLDCGTEDMFQLHDGMQYLHDLLDEAGIPHAYYIGPGGHDFGFWSQRIDDSLAFFAEKLARQ